MEDVKNKQWEGGYCFKEFDVKRTIKEFRYSRRQVLGLGEKVVPSNISAAWVANPSLAQGQLEILIGGVLQGRKQYDVRGASWVCKKGMWKAAIEIAVLAAVPSIVRCLSRATYAEVKTSECLQGRREVKEDVRASALKGWVRNVGGEGFRIEGNGWNEISSK